MRTTIPSAVGPVLTGIAIGLASLFLIKALSTSSPSSTTFKIEYHLVLVDDVGEEKLAIQYCNLTGCRLIGYRWDPNNELQKADAEETFNRFAHPRKESTVISVVK